MTEINNNIPKFNKINNNIVKDTKISSDNLNMPDKTNSENYVQDTGVLGRSQVASPIGLDVSKSVDEAVKLAMEDPTLLEASDDFYENMYAALKAEGDDEAYERAVLAEGEFVKTANDFKHC